MPELLGLSLYNDANLQEYYQLEDLTGKNGNTLTNNNTATFVAAKFGNGVSGGSSDANKSLSVASALGYGGGAYSISLWVKLNTEVSGTTYDFIELGDAGSDTTLLISYADAGGGDASLTITRVALGVSAPAVVTVDPYFGTTNYNHIVLTYDGSTLEGYLNSVSMGTIAASGSGSVAVTTGLHILEGRTANTNNTLGIIDDVALFNRALTAAEVSTIYTQTSTPGGSFLTNFL